MNHFVTLLVISAMLSPLVKAANPPNREEAVKRIEQAVAKSNIFELSSFEMKADVQVDNRGKPLQGTYELLWNGPEQWKEQIAFPGYSEVEVGGKGIVWVKRTTEFIPFHVFHIHAALGFGLSVPSGGFGDMASYTQMRITPKDDIKKVRSEKRDGDRLTCFEVEDGGKHKAEICVNDVTGIIARESPYEDKDFQAIGGKLFPRFLTYVEERKVVAKISVKELTTPAVFPPNSFDPPGAGVSPQAGCMNPMPARIVRNVLPEYPQGARQNRIEGMVGVDVSIGVDGAPVINTVVASPNSDLAKSSVDAIKNWRYDPATCNGKPVPIETVLTVRYALR